MPRKTKDLNNIEENIKKNYNKIADKGTNKSANKVNSVKKKTASKKESNKVTTAKKTTSKRASTKTKDKKEPTKKINSKTIKKDKSNKSSNRSNIKKQGSIVELVEYYDLPYRYNQTVVKILAQTPNTLFIYWDISDEDRESYKKTYGDNFFEVTKPILIVYNETMNYSFEIDINDFANSWYVHVNDSKCNYKIELGRRPTANNQKIENNYIYISSSNDIVIPNDKILFNVNPENVKFKDVKTKQNNSKSISRISSIVHLHQMERTYNIYNLYKKLYKDENLNKLLDSSFSNPSSDSFLSKFM